MKNTNKQNPLKTFNDNYAAKAKKVVEGNNKLVKAQVGKIVKDSIAASNAERLKTILKGGYKPDNKGAVKFGIDAEDTLTKQYFSRKRPEGYTQYLGVQKKSLSNPDTSKKMGGVTKSNKLKKK